MMLHAYRYTWKEVMMYLAFVVCHTSSVYDTWPPYPSVSSGSCCWWAKTSCGVVVIWPTHHLTQGYIVHGDCYITVYTADTHGMVWAGLLWLLCTQLLFMHSSHITFSLHTFGLTYILVWFILTCLCSYFFVFMCVNHLLNNHLFLLIII